MTQQTQEAPVETERKFLVQELPEDLKAFPRDKIRQGYLASEDGTEVRVRAVGKKYYLTVKAGGGVSRDEVELRLRPKDFAALWPLTRGKRVWKRRYHIPHGNRTVEVDVYRHRLKGLITAEVEFPTAEAAEKFKVPEWLGRDITEDHRYANRTLATQGAPADGPGETAEDGHGVPAQDR